MGIQSPPLKLSNPPQSSRRVVEETAHSCFLSIEPSTYTIDLSQKELLSDTCTKPELKKFFTDEVLLAVIPQLFNVNGRGLKTVRAEHHGIFHKLRCVFSRSPGSYSGTLNMLIT